MVAIYIYRINAINPRGIYKGFSFVTFVFLGPLRTFHVGVDPSLRLPADVEGFTKRKYRTVQNPQKKL